MAAGIPLTVTSLGPCVPRGSDASGRCLRRRGFSPGRYSSRGVLSPCPSAAASWMLARASVAALRSPPLKHLGAALAVLGRLATLATSARRSPAAWLASLSSLSVAVGPLCLLRRLLPMRVALVVVDPWCRFTVSPSRPRGRGWLAPTRLGSTRLPAFRPLWLAWVPLVWAGRCTHMASRSPPRGCCAGIR